MNVNPKMMVVPAVVAILIGVVRAAVPAGDAVKGELERYCREVVTVIAEAEAASEPAGSAPAASSGAPADEAELAAIRENDVIPAYRKILARAEAFKAATPEVRKLNERVIHDYTALVENLGTWMEDCRGTDAARAEHALESISNLSENSFANDLTRLCTEHKVAVPAGVCEGDEPASRGNG